MTELEPLLETRDAALRKLNDAREARQHLLETWRETKRPADMRNLKSADALQRDADADFRSAQQALDTARMGTEEDLDRA